ncbi:MAG: MnhB domain-containing protein [Halanaerobiales bacterium]
MKIDDQIITIITSLLLPFITLFGIYLIFHVHLSPGGGFSGGTVVGSAFILFSLAYGISVQERKISHRTSTFLESMGAIWYVFIGLAGIFAGYEFLTNDPVFSLGEIGTLFSSGTVQLINIGIGIKVASTIISLFDSIGGEEM